MDKGILVITDQNTHGAGESIYPLLKEMLKDRRATFIDVLSRGNMENNLFFEGKSQTDLYVNRVTQKYEYSRYSDFYRYPFKSSQDFYDVVFLRIDRPISNLFLDFIKKTFINHLIINDPKGIQITGSKDFLINFPELCPPISLCNNFEDLENFNKNYPIILKPLQSYGGIGIVKIENQTVTIDGKEIEYSQFKEEFKEKIKLGFLAMKFLKRVTEGDKRVIVINGEIMGAILRYPPEGSFLCNLKQGGYSAFADVDKDELHIAKTLSPIMNSHHVTIFGFDTLVDDDGVRKLSEINTLNVGGLVQAENHSNKPIVKNSSTLIWDFIDKYKKNTHNNI